eukprot:UN03479
MTWIQSHTRIIIYVLIAITMLLFLICNMLIVMIIKQSIQNAQNTNVAAVHLDPLDDIRYEGSVRSETLESNSFDI